MHEQFLISNMGADQCASFVSTKCMAIKQSCCSSRCLGTEGQTATAATSVHRDSE